MHCDAQFNSKNRNEKKYKKLCCPSCSFENIIKRGFRKTENRGKIQRYSCKNCSHRFVVDDGFFRMGNHPKKITCALKEQKHLVNIDIRKIYKKIKEYF